MTNKYFFILLILFFNQVLPQNTEFGEVSLNELEEESYLNDKDANAAILYKKIDTYLISSGGNSRLVTYIQERIKIYNNDGFDSATKEVYLFKNRTSAEKVQKLKAFTFNLVNGEIEKTELEKDQIFETESSYYYNKLSFTMPNVKEGSVIELKYEVSSPFIWSIDSFVFQYDIPVKKLDAEIRNPKGFNFKKTPKGNIFVFPKTFSKRDNRIGMDVVVTKYALNNVPALKEESFVDNIDNYRSGVMFELMSIDIPGLSKSYAKSWKDVAKTIGSSSDYKNELDKTRLFTDNVESLISGMNSDEERMKVIFKHVKENFKWNGVDGKYFLNGFKKTLKEKSGNAADINLLLVAMLRNAGLDANPVLISTKENTIPFFPTVDRLNYVIGYVKANEKSYYLDATNKFSDLNLLPLKDYNWRGILINNPDKVWALVDLNTPKTGTKRFFIESQLKVDGSLEGKLSSRFSNHFAMTFREFIEEVDKENYVSELETKLSDIEISNHEVKNIDELSGPVSESFEFYQDAAAEDLGGKLYLKPMLFLAMDENPFKSETRDYPIDFGFPFKNDFVFKIKLPEGYKVESLPKSIMMKIPNNLGMFKYNTNSLDGIVDVTVSYSINKARVSTEDYLFLKQFYNQMISKESEPLVLSKI
ncbi:DUF3857 domain-containing protein [uncultured Croceitalea sp.]|uniref:transglutaminase domain-containing protein n=1 Tax=uncultured Croceitalea sp. TaxID=1798908 RepID=UPI00330589FB